MDNTTSFVARPMRHAAWHLIRGGKQVAAANALCRPDRRWYVSVDSWDADAYPELVAAMADDVRQDLYTTIDGSDDIEMHRWRELGFEIVRREIEYVIRVATAHAALADARVPDGLVVLQADAVDERGLRELDDALRCEVPGCDDWRNDPAEFHDYTFDERHFDPDTYLVAVDDERRAFAGLVRVWSSPERGRLGLIGVLPDYRRRGLAAALLSAAFRPLVERGTGDITAEADVTNDASNSLLERIGARRTGSSVEMVRRRCVPEERGY